MLQVLTCVLPLICFFICYPSVKVTYFQKNNTYRNNCFTCLHIEKYTKQAFLMHPYLSLTQSRWYLQMSYWGILHVSNKPTILLMFLANCVLGMLVTHFKLWCGEICSDLYFRHIWTIKLTLLLKDKCMY